MAERTKLATYRRAQEPGERSADEIRRSIAAERETITDTVDKLGGRAYARDGHDAAFTSWVQEQLTTIRKRRQLIEAAALEIPGASPTR